MKLFRYIDAIIAIAVNKTLFEKMSETKKTPLEEKLLAIDKIRARLSDLRTIERYRDGFNYIRIYNNARKDGVGHTIYEHDRIAQATIIAIEKELSLEKQELENELKTLLKVE